MFFRHLQSVKEKFRCWLSISCSFHCLSRCSAPGKKMLDLSAAIFIATLLPQFQYSAPLRSSVQRGRTNVQINASKDSELGNGVSPTVWTLNWLAASPNSILSTLISVMLGGRQLAMFLIVGCIETFHAGTCKYPLADLCRFPTSEQIFWQVWAMKYWHKVFRIILIFAVWNLWWAG